MKLLDKLKGGFAYNKMAKAYKDVLTSLNTYEYTRDTSYLYKAVWVFRHCIYESIEKWNWNIFAGIWIPDHHQLGRITVHEANLIIISKIESNVQNLEDGEKDIVDMVFDGKEIPEVECLISETLKERLLP